MQMRMGDRGDSPEGFGSEVVNDRGDPWEGAAAGMVLMIVRPGTASRPLPVGFREVHP
jgi:hypothetical protein